MNKKIRAVAAAAAVIGVVFIGKMISQRQEIEAVQEAVVKVENPVKQNIIRKTELIGKVEPQNIAYLYPKITGTIIEINAKAGDTVKQGDQICVIESSMVDTSKDQLDAAKLALKQAKETLDRQTILYQGGGLSEEAYHQYQDAVTAAELTCRSAETQYEEAYASSRVSAPLDGTLETLGVTLHNTVSLEQPICVISGKGSKVVSFYVTDRVRRNLKAGDKMIVRKDGTEYDASIFEVNHMADSTTGLFLVKAGFAAEQDTRTIPVGSAVEVCVISEKAEAVLSVSTDAIYQDMDQAYVYIYEEGSVRKTLVETGVSDAKITEIRSGLQAEDQVLSTWSQDLYEGAKVRLTEQEEE